MIRYLVVFITEGQFACETVMADNFIQAYEAFGATGLNFEYIFSISIAR